METINFKDLFKETKLTESVVMFNDTKIKVKQYLDLDSKKNIIDFALQGGKTPKFINRLVSDALFNYLIVLSYTNIVIKDWDEIEAYNFMEESGLIDLVYSAIPKEEIESLTEYYNMAINDYNTYVGSFKGLIEGIIVNIPEQVEALSKALEEFDPSQLKILNELTSSVVSGK